MDKLPNFATLEEEAEFWEHHNLTEYIDEALPRAISLGIPKQ